MAYAETYSDTHANSHLADTATTAGAAADKVASNNAKYRQLANSHIFVPVAIESAGTWNHQAVELVQELGRRMAAVNFWMLTNELTNVMDHNTSQYDVFYTA